MSLPTVFDDRFLVTWGGWTVTRHDEDRAPVYLDDRLDDPDRDLERDPADVEAERWEREMARRDVSRRDP